MASNNLITLATPADRLTPDRVVRIFVATVATLLIVGAPRSGKFWGILQQLREYADRREGGMLCLFPMANENAPLLIQHLHADGHGHRIWADSLDSATMVLPLLCFIPSRSADPYTRAIENVLIRDCLLELLGRGRKEPIEQQPLIIELATKAIELCLAATCTVTLRHLLAVGKEGHPLFVELLDNCPDPELVWFWTSLPKQGAALRREIAALWRLLDQKFGHPQILTRDSRENLLQKVLEAGQIVIIEGGASKWATTIYLCLLSMMAIQIIRNHFAKTGKPLWTLVLADELGYGLFGEFEKTAVQQLPKGGFFYVGITHSLRLLADSNQNTEALQSFHALHGYRCADWDTALYIAHLAATAVDPYREHHRDSRTVQRHDGFDEQTVITKNTSKGRSGDRDTENESVSRGTRQVPRYVTNVEETIRYDSRNDQFIDLAARVMGLRKQERLTVINGQVCFERVPHLELPWIIEEYGQVKLSQFLAEMHRRPEYRRPSIGVPVVMSSPRTSGSIPAQTTNAMNGRNGSGSTKSHSDPVQALLDVLRPTGRNRDVR
ncbi:MAG TPA: hypothetical protein VHV55_26530 [Pirellulales bacterium]|jgi:hypothetical protein|nr:hypothetical protein [Pirellulales bacterium]